MIVAFVGTIYEGAVSPISGNGKTGSMTGLSMLDHYMKNKYIWSNYYTDFSERVCGLQEMIEIIGNDKHPDLILCISEMHQILNSVGSKKEQVLFIERFTSQLRKLGIELYYDTQRFQSIHVRLRAITDTIFIPRKYHFDGCECNYNLCKEPHAVYLYSYKPDLGDKPRIIFKMSEVGKHYDHEETIFDTINIQKIGSN